MVLSRAQTAASTPLTHTLDVDAGKMAVTTITTNGTTPATEKGRRGLPKKLSRQSHSDPSEGGNMYLRKVERQKHRTRLNAYKNTLSRIGARPFPITAGVEYKRGKSLFNIQAVLLSGPGPHMVGIVTAGHYLTQNQIRERIKDRMNGAPLKGMRYSIWHEGTCLRRYKFDRRWKRIGGVNE